MDTLILSHSCEEGLEAMVRFVGGLASVGLGSPRGEVQADVTDVLNYVHLWPRGCVTFKGAHESRQPVMHDPFVKHSLERNSRIVWWLQRKGKLTLDELVTHVVQPEDVPAPYHGLRAQKDEYLGVVTDWTE